MPNKHDCDDLGFDGRETPSVGDSKCRTLNAGTIGSLSVRIFYYFADKASALGIEKVNGSLALRDNSGETIRVPFSAELNERERVTIKVPIGALDRVRSSWVMNCSSLW